MLYLKKKINEKVEIMITLEPSRKPNKNQQAQIDRKYGMFIHFGINTFNDTEWSDGKLPIESYNPPEIDADGWIKNAYEAGMSYVILICKHHDGFCLWDTNTTTYSVNHSSNKTDVVAEVSKACKKYGIKLGLYYSLWDRHEKCYKNHEEYVEYMCKHLTELLGGKYGEICEVWLDGGWDKKTKLWNIPKLYDLIHTLQPNCVCSTNVTIAPPYRKKSINKYLPQRYKEGMPIRYFPSDFRLWDPNFTRVDDPKLYSHNGKLYYLPFEATICIRNMRNWFWDPKYTKDKLVGVDFIVDKYNLLVNSDNVLVVNVAPNIYGKQETEDIAHLLEVADKLGIRRHFE